MALITCSKCGKRVSDKAKACPHCGSPVKLADSEPVQEEILRNQEPIHQSQSEAESRHLHESQPKPQLQAEPTHDQDDEPKKGKGGLVAILVVALLVLLAGAGWLWYDNSQKQAEMEQQLAIQREQARQDSIAAAELREQVRRDSITEAKKQEQINIIYNEYIKVLKKHEYGGCFLFDITKDGIPELWVTAYDESEKELEWPALHIFTITNSRARKLCDATSGGSYYQGDDYIIANWNWIGDDFALIKLTYNGNKIVEERIRFYTWEEEDNLHISEPKIFQFNIDDNKILMSQIESYF